MGWLIALILVIGIPAVLVLVALIGLLKKNAEDPDSPNWGWGAKQKRINNGENASGSGNLP